MLALDPDPGVSGCYLVMKKGAISGSISAADLKLDGTSLSGTITGKSGNIGKSGKGGL